MLRRRKSNGFFATLASFVFFSLAAFGGWTLYNKNEKEVKSITEKTVNVTNFLIKAIAGKAKSLVDEANVPLAVNGSMVWTCWFKPDSEALKKCRASNACSGAIVYSQHKIQRESIKLGATKCAEEFGKCRLDYCQRGG